MRIAQAIFRKPGARTTVADMSDDHGHRHEHDQHDQHDHHQRTVERHCDVAVIGGSAAGLAAALQLVRQQRTVVVVDDATPRNAPAAHMHGYLGHDGVPPAELGARGREEVRSYGGEVLAGRVVAVRRGDSDERLRVELTGGHTLLARRVVAATGIEDELPAIEGLAEHWGVGVVHCPFCHGYETRGQRIVQVLTSAFGLHPTPLLAHLAGSLTVVVHDAEVSEDTLAPYAAAGVAIERSGVRRIIADGARLTGVELDDGRVVAADSVLVGPRFRARSEAFAPLGLEPVEHASGLGTVVEADLMGQTPVPGVFAAGNLVDPGLQVLMAAAHGSRVGAGVAFSLAQEDLAAGVRSAGPRTDWEHRYAGEQPMWSAHPNGTLVAEATALPPGRALDVGAGEGADVLWLAERGWEATAVDISENALARIRAEAARRGLAVTCLQADANDVGAFGDERYDLVSLQYGSFHRTPEGRGVAQLLDAVAPGGTLLVVAHDLAPMRAPIDVVVETRMWDPEAYAGVEEIAAALADADGWEIEVHQTRPRPPGAASGHHVDDVVLRARRLASA